MSIVELTQWSGNVKFYEGRFEMKTVYYTQNDTAPALTVTLYDEDGNAKNLAGATITFTMVDQVDGSTKISAAVCTIVDATNGKFKYEWAAGDLDTPGYYFGEFEITVGGKVETVGDRLTVVVRKGL